MPINYTTGDATAPEGDSPKLIVHVCNDKGGWGKGFVVAISKRWEEPEAGYRRWHKKGGNPPFELGQVQFAEVEPNLWVANMIGQHGMGQKRGKPPIRYEAVEEGLRRVAEFASQKEASVHMPRIGCGLAGGEWQEIKQIIERTLVASGIEVTGYDFK